ncbi:hypothetical protein AKJ16_DCAP05477 [Drosera capensis]
MAANQYGSCGSYSYSYGGVPETWCRRFGTFPFKGPTIPVSRGGMKKRSAMGAELSIFLYETRWATMEAKAPPQARQTKFEAYDSKCAVVAGDKNKEVLVRDIWVFEKSLCHPGSYWRLCGRITTNANDSKKQGEKQKES